MSLSVVILASGTLLITYSPFLYTFYGDSGKLWVSLFDISLFAVLPALYYYFEKIYGPGPYRILRYCRRFQVAYSGICMIFLVLNIFAPQSFYEAYYFVSVKILGILIIVEAAAVDRNYDSVCFQTEHGCLYFLRWIRYDGSSDGGRPAYLLLSRRPLCFCFVEMGPRCDDGFPDRNARTQTCPQS